MLTATEATTLEIYEGVIAAGLDAFVEVGTALMQIREGRLYRATHGTFEAYCLERWKLSKTYVYDTIKASKAVQNVRNCERLPENQSQASEIGRLDPDEQAEAWQEAVDTAPTDDEGEPVITAKHVKEVVDRRKGGEAKQAPAREVSKLPEWIGVVDSNLCTQIATVERYALESRERTKLIGLLQTARETLEAYVTNNEAR